MGFLDDAGSWLTGGTNRQGGSLMGVANQVGNTVGGGVNDGLSFLSGGKPPPLNQPPPIDQGVAQINTGPSDQWRGQQQTLANMYMQQANGQGPSLAQGQLQQATDRNLQQAMALGASQRGAGTAGGLKSIFDHQSQIGSQMASDSALLRLQEQMSARNALGGILNAGRGQDIGLATAQQQGNLGLAGLNSGNALSWEQMRQKQFSDAANARAQLIQGIFSAGSQGASGLMGMAGGGGGGAAAAAPAAAAPAAAAAGTIFL